MTKGMDAKLRVTLAARHLVTVPGYPVRRWHDGIYGWWWWHWHDGHLQWLGATAADVEESAKVRQNLGR